MIDLLAGILFALSMPLLVVLTAIALDSVVSPQEMSDYRIKVRDFRRAGMSDEQICKELQITKKFLMKIENRGNRK